MNESPLSAQDVIERLCTLQAEVSDHIGHSSPADCFCCRGGFWSVEGYGGTHRQGYRNAGLSLEFIETAVREKLAALSGYPRAAQEET